MRTSLNLLLCLAAVAAISTAASAQGLFLDQGTSGWYLGGAYLGQDDIDGYAGGVGYSVQGNVDFGLQYTRQSLWNGRTYASVTESLRGHMVKPTPAHPYGVTVLLAFEQGRYHYPDDEFGPRESQSTSSMIMGGEFVLAAYGTGRFDYYPYMGMTLQMSKVGSIDAGWAYPMHLGLAVVADHRFVLDASVTNFESATAYIVSLGVIF